MGGPAPVGIKIVIEGQEEVGSALNDYPATHPDLFRADAMLIADMGSVRPGVPTLTIGLRGMAQTTMDVETLAGPKHSGQYGGAAPDALGVLLQALATLHDENGDVAVEGLRREPWTGAGYSEDEFRTWPRSGTACRSSGSGDLGSRVWSGPAITVTGIDITSVDNALNAVYARARAKINPRVHPAQDADEAQEAVIRHLEAVRPFGSGSTVHPGVTGNGFLAETTSPRTGRRTRRWRRPGVEASFAATGGSIPLVNALHVAVPGGRDPAPRDDRRLREHPRAERARAARRVREGRARRDGVPRPFAEAFRAGRARRSSERAGCPTPSGCRARGGDDAAASSEPSSAAATRCRTPRSCSSGCA